MFVSYSLCLGQVLAVDGIMSESVGEMWGSSRFEGWGSTDMGEGLLCHQESRDIVTLNPLLLAATLGPVQLYKHIIT